MYHREFVSSPQQQQQPTASYKQQKESNFKGKYIFNQIDSRKINNTNISTTYEKKEEEDEDKKEESCRIL